MVNVIISLKVALLASLIIAASSADLPDIGVISSFLEQFIRPYVETIKQNKTSFLEVDGPVPRSSPPQETSIQKAVRLKVAELKPFLQDDYKKSKITETDDNITLEGNDETTIIEFMPNKKATKLKGSNAVLRSRPSNDTFKQNISKYKKLKKTIIKKLENEKTELATVKLITHTLDDMIAQLIEKQCTWNAVDKSLRKQISRTRLDTDKSIQKLQDLSKHEWKDLRRQYLNYLQARGQQEESFLTQFHDFFSSVINDTWKMSHHYKVRCQLIKVDNHNENKRALRMNEEVKDVKDAAKDDKCEIFIICTEELTEFLNSFYLLLNDTAVSVFKNYGAMYIRDVNADPTQDKDLVVSVLDNISKSAERKVKKIFKKELSVFKLDEKKSKAANIKHISEFVTSTVEQIKNVLRLHLDHELGAMKSKLFSTVNDDLNVNLKGDLDNLNTVIILKICKLFTFCNGVFASRRSGAHYRSAPLDDNKMFVKVQVTFDDDVKEAINKNSLQSLLNPFGSNGRRSFSRINITRTPSFPTSASVKRPLIIPTRSSKLTTPSSTISTLSSTKSTLSSTVPTKHVVVVNGMPLIENNEI